MISRRVRARICAIVFASLAAPVFAVAARAGKPPDAGPKVKATLRVQFPATTASGLANAAQATGEPGCDHYCHGEEGIVSAWSGVAFNFETAGYRSLGGNQPGKGKNKDTAARQARTFLANPPMDTDTDVQLWAQCRQCGPEPGELATFTDANGDGVINALDDPDPCDTLEEEADFDCGLRDMDPFSSEHSPGLGGCAGKKSCKVKAKHNWLVAETPQNRITRKLRYGWRCEDPNWYPPEDGRDETLATVTVDWPNDDDGDGTMDGYELVWTISAPAAEALCEQSEGVTIPVAGFERGQGGAFEWKIKETATTKR